MLRPWRTLWEICFPSTWGAGFLESILILLPVKVVHEDGDHNYDKQQDKDGDNYCAAGVGRLLCSYYWCRWRLHGGGCCRSSGGRGRGGCQLGVVSLEAVDVPYLQRLTGLGIEGSVTRAGRVELLLEEHDTEFALAVHNGDKVLLEEQQLLLVVSGRADFAIEARPPD